MPELWTKGLAEIKERIDKQNYETWFKPIRFVSRNKNEIVLEVPNKFFRDWLTEHYVRQMENLLSGIAAQEVKVLFQINEELETRPRQEKILKKEQKNIYKISWFSPTG